MAFSTRIVSLAFISFVRSATSLPGPQSIGSDLAIITHNDLYGDSSTRQAAAIVLGKEQTYKQSRSSCAELGETLWALPGPSSDLSFLRYLAQGGRANRSEIFWVDSPVRCEAIDAEGQVQKVNCDARLPALCSQSATLSTKSGADTDPKWQIVVRSRNGSVVGYRDRLSFRFQGIRYAPQPERFTHSRYSPLSGNISALSYGPSCVQAGCNGNLFCSEDCLNLNIWTPYLPSSKGTKRKAVMVWIHGGGFTGGSGTDTTFDGGNMASRGDVVVVTINYRLSTLGFLALDGTGLTGNYGLADQNTALDWLRAHIEDFGGDKDRITVFGQSAGAASVRALLASPQADGKFSRAIMQSNPGGAQYASSFTRYLTLQEATDRTRAILTEIGCSQADNTAQLACLREQDPLKLVGLRNGSWYPVIDGSYLPEKELPLGDTAARKKVALMTGVMRDDGAPFSKFSTSSNASQALTEQGFDASSILRSGKFPLVQAGNTTINIFNLTSRVATDAMFRCLGQSTASVGAGNQIFQGTYAYEFDRAYQIAEWSPNPPTCEAPVSASRPFGDVRQPYFKCHSGELYYVFGTLIRQNRVPRDEDDIPFSQYIVDTWTAFARGGDPNPNMGFLRARGFLNTSSAIERTDPWLPVQPGASTLRILDKDVRNEGFRELEQCDVLGYPLDFFPS
ncbi:cholinesterase [Aaosphaeria arxii CBS 175.79]|uniref:Carboxylic ester hydrolase n=1 Tax=Aaosphaeria arxii CBS 175.79 TaxID=1450172 RepID=A0A6A5Y3J0_9PLEO|nr:cholinesterase [Aaosphaeria arxii CBS 175.79]KAF2019380.1 cholinesterase [Aaosphaeria arxii CBS 175.79]